MTGQQLKNSILQMAVQGKLVPQDPNDEPASVLLERIRKEKEQLIKEGKIKKEKNPSYIFRGADNLPYEKVGKNEPVCIADEVPFEIPDSWKWVRLKELTIKEIKRGKSPKYAEDGIVYVFAQKCNVKLGGIDISLAKFLDNSVFGKYPVEEYMADGDIIINSTGNGTLGRIGIFRDSDRINDFVIVPDSHVTIIRTGNQIIKDYLFFALKYHQPHLEKLGEGSTNQTELRPSTVAELFIPVPPVGEQERIVAKLLEVLPMADVYGTKEKALQDYNRDFPVQLKKSILQEAVQGKLIPQDPNDEPASVLLERIRAEKERLIKAGKIKRDKHESVIFRRDNSHYEKCGLGEVCIDDEIPFEIPETWLWCRLRSILSQASTGPFGSMLHKSDYTDTGIPIINPANIINGNINSNKIKRVSERTAEQLISYKFQSGDVIIGRRGEMGRSAAVTNDQAGWICGTGCFYVTPLSLLHPDYLVFLLSSPYVKMALTENSVGTTMNNLNHNILGKLLVPIPPKDEQLRIILQYKKIISYLGD